MIITMTTTYAPTHHADPQPTSPAPSAGTRRQSRRRIRPLQHVLSLLADGGPATTQHGYLQGPNGAPLWTEGVQPR